MGHIADPVGAVVVGCKVLPIFNENGIVDGAVKKIVHRIDGKKAVARMKELLKWAAQARPHSSTVSGKKWKKVVSFQASKERASKCGPGDDMMSSGSGKLSFKWDAGSCSSASSVVYSPLSFASAPAAKAAKTREHHRHHHTPSRNYMSRVSQKRSSSVASLLYSSSPTLREDEEEEEEACRCRRMGQWITTDSDFVVLEL